MFHFLTDAADRRKYVDLARRTVPEGGHLIIASFADDGPKRCSDLDVCRYNAESMAAELGEGFLAHPRGQRNAHDAVEYAARRFSTGCSGGNETNPCRGHGASTEPAFDCSDCQSSV